MDNLNTHCRKSLTDHLGGNPGRYLWTRLKVHYTPNTAAGSTKPKSNSACCRDNASAPAAYPNWIYWLPASAPGTPRLTATGTAFNGSSPAKQLAGSGHLAAFSAWDLSSCPAVPIWLRFCNARSGSSRARFQSEHRTSCNRGSGHSHSQGTLTG